jgi:putative transposase
MGKRFVTLDSPLENVTDEEEYIYAPKFLRRSLKHLAKAQQHLQRTTPGSNRYHKALRRVQRLHGKVAAQRRNWSQHLAIALTETADTIVVEDLNLKGMARRKGKKGFKFGKSISDNGWGQFVLILKEQANKRGATVLVASRWYPSSKTCSGCGAAKAKLSLKTRQYDCSFCGLSLDRDVNAARNLAQLAVTHEKVTFYGVTDAGEASSTKSCNVEGLVPVTVDAAAFEALLESLEATLPLTLV